MSYLLELAHSSMIMRMRAQSDEAQRRKIDLRFDLFPTYGHAYIAGFIRPFIKSKKVLDVGCWTGQLESLIQNDVAALMGIEPNKNAVAFARSHHPHLKFRVATADALPFDDNSFDIVLLLDVLEHVPENTENLVLTEIHRVLEKRGKLLLTTPNAHWLSILFDPAYFLIGHRHYSTSRLTELLRQNKFTVHLIKKYGGLAHLAKCLIDIVTKHVFNKKVDIYPLVKKNVEQEFLVGGFAALFVVAEKR